MKKNKYKDIGFSTVMSILITLLCSVFCDFSDFEFMVTWSLMYIVILKTLEH